MARQRTHESTRHDGEDQCLKRPLRNLGVSCMLNTEVSAVLAAIRRSSDGGSFAPSPVDGDLLVSSDTHLLHSLRSLRSVIFQPGTSNWLTIVPAIYLGPFLDVIQSGGVPAAATGVALSAIHKILKLGVFDEKTPGAGDAVHAVVLGAAACRLERTDPAAEDAVLMRVLQVMATLMKHKAAVLLSDHAVCMLVNTCFQVVQQSSLRGHLLQRSARYAMHDLVQTIFARLPEVQPDECNSNSRSEEEGEEGGGKGYGGKCMANIFQFLCSLLNVFEVTDEGYEDDIQLFVLILINSAVELGGEFMGDHPKILRSIQDDLFHHLVVNGTRSSPLLLSTICSTVLNLYHFLRGSLRLQLEAFFSCMLQRMAPGPNGSHLQEIALDGIIGFCRQPSFAIQMYVNYDCDPIRQDIFEETVRSLCRAAFPTNPSLSPMQILAFEGLVALVDAIADNTSSGSNLNGENTQIVISEFKPFWIERSDAIIGDLEGWVDFIRLRKFKKKKIMMAGNHFNRDEKKGLEFLKISRLVPDNPDPKSIAFFFRFTPGLDKNKIGDFLGEPGEFNVQVLKEFALTFDFPGVILDTALRTFLETFRLPGESQKIQRILEAFSERFYEQQSTDMFATMDAVFVLCYSLIMLNTDQHNPQVKKKMTEEEFIRNNRAINGGKDLPRDYLSELFQSISKNAITLFAQSGSPSQISTSRWIELVRRSKLHEPFIFCDFNQRLCRDALAAIAGPLIATLSAIFEHADDEETLHVSVEGFFSIARISQHGLQDIIDEIITCFSKFTSLLNPYATLEETLFNFTNDVRSRMATIALFTIANRFGPAIRGGWRNILDCLLKLKTLKLLPQPLIEPEKPTDSPASVNISPHSKSESAVLFPSPAVGRTATSRQGSGLMGKFSQFLSLDNGADSLAEACSELENNLKLIQQCQIGNIFSESSKLPEEALLTLGRTLIFAAAGKGQKFNTLVDEEETVGLCWDILAAISQANINRFTAFWPQFHDSFTVVAQLPLFSPCPFLEKAIVGLFTICLKLFSRSSSIDKSSEDLIFKSINLMWKLDKEIFDSCSESVSEFIVQILMDHRSAMQTQIGWKSVLQLLAITGRHPETFKRSVEALITLMEEKKHINRSNYGFCVEAALGFATSKNCPLEESIRIIDLMGDSVQRLVQWQKSGVGENNGSASVLEDGGKAGGNMDVSLFMKLAEAMRKISLMRREEIRNHAVAALRRCFTVGAAELEFTTVSSMWCFNHVVFALVDDLQQKMAAYSRREGSEREMRSTEGTLMEAMELSAEVLLLFLTSLHQNPSFRNFWLGFMRRMDTCVKGAAGALKDLVPELLRKVIIEMKKKGILVQRRGDELWETTNIQIQWIAPSIKDELFPEEF